MKEKRLQVIITVVNYNQHSDIMCETLLEEMLNEIDFGEFFVQSIKINKKENEMKIIFQNNQHTPHLNFVNSAGKIAAQISLCKDGLLVTGNLDVLKYLYPKRDGIVIAQLPSEIHKSYLKIKETKCKSKKTSIT